MAVGGSGDNQDHQKLYSQLLDGDHDFQIELTENGERIVSQGLTFSFRDPEYSIDARPASEWFIELLRAAQGETLNLTQVMEAGNTDGDIAILDDCGNKYGFGSGTYAWAFEVVLWHHARRGDVVPMLGTADNVALWESFVSCSDRPSRPCIYASHPLWTIEFCLADTVNDNTDVIHVGRVSSGRSSYFPIPCNPYDRLNIQAASSGASAPSVVVSNGFTISVGNAGCWDRVSRIPPAVAAR